MVARRLSLRRETLADLTPGELAAVAAGTFTIAACTGPTARSCPTISPEWCHSFTPECTSTTR